VRQEFLQKNTRKQETTTGTDGRKITVYAAPRNIELVNSSILTAVALAAILGVGACLRAAAVGAAMPRERAAPAGDVPNACANILEPRDLAAILGPSGVTASAEAANPTVCRFDGPGRTAVAIALRSGDEVAPFWKLALDANHGAMVPLAGVGDTALRTRDGAEVIARKGSLSCQAHVAGIDEARTRTATHAAKDGLAQKLGALCNKVFSARRARPDAPSRSQRKG
jgi:hypothetical protein